MKMPKIKLRDGARPIVIADLSAPLLVGDRYAAVLAEAAAESEQPQKSFRALGYRQTLLPACKGGTMLNSHGWRIRNGGMRALARSFKGKAFVSGHIWGDARARGGDIVNGFAQEIEDDTEIAIFYDVIAKAPWSIEGLANGTIDRFSIALDPQGEITCTVHDVPVWSTDDCWCWPGQTVEDGMIAEWEFEDGIGLELSAVNVPAVDGTKIVEAGDEFDGAQAYRALAALCGRQSVRASRELSAGSRGGAQQGGFRPAPAPITMARKEAPMDPREEMAKALGLPVTATWDEIRAKQAQVSAEAAQAGVARAQLAEVAAREQQLAAERDAAHVEAEITRLRAARQVSDAVIETLRTSAKNGRTAFDSSLALVEASAAPIAPGAGATRAELQSDKKPATVPGSVDLDEEGPDAYEANRANPNLGKLMKWAAVSADDVRKHGSRQFNVLPNLRELADATAARRA